jgi:hypothetical protein
VPEISQAIALAIVREFGLDCSSVALDMTNFATFIATANGKAPTAQRGKAKQKRSDLRLVGALRARHKAICAAAGAAPAPEMTVVFDAGQNSEDNFAYLAGTGLHYVGSVPASGCPDLISLPASVRSIVDVGRFSGLTACDTRREFYGTERRAILTHSPELHESQAPRVRRHHLGQSRQETRRAGRHPGPRQDPPPRGQGRSRDRLDHPQALVRRVLTWQLTGDQPFRSAVGGLAGVCQNAARLTGSGQSS